MPPFKLTKEMSNPSISFKRVSTLPTSGYSTGEVYFVSSENKIYVRTETEWEAYGGGGSSVAVDSAMSSTSENPVQNKVITVELEGNGDLPDWEEDANGGSTRAYKTGEYCKKPCTDPDTGETKTYAFRFLSPIAVGDAWDSEKAVQTSVFGELKEMVIGDRETLTIGISSSDGQMTVSGISVIVKNVTTGAQQTLVTGTDGTVSLLADKGDVLDISAAQQSGYQKPGTVRHKATMNKAYVYIVYQKTVETCTVTVMLRTESGAVIGAGDVIALNLDNASSLTATVDANGSAIFENVPQGHTGTVKVIRHLGYVTPAAQSFDTTHAAVSLDFTYSPTENPGILMVRSDGQEFYLDDWNSEDTLAALHVKTQDLLDNDADYYVKPECLTAEWFTNAHNLRWSDDSLLYPNVPYDSDADWDGAGNTAAMLADAAEQNTASPAATFATGQTLTLNGQTAGGYIGTKRQLNVLIVNNDTVYSMLAAAGFTGAYYAKYIWTSTQCNANNAWNWYSGSWYDGAKARSFSVLPFFAV